MYELVLCILPELHNPESDCVSGSIYELFCNYEYIWTSGLFECILRTAFCYFSKLNLPPIML